MSEKIILITTPLGFIWELSATFVADLRAKHYADDPDSSYQKEFDYAMSEGGEYELVDWLGNNMNWEDFSEVCKLVHTPDIQFPHQGGDLIAIVKRDESEN